MRAYLLTHLSDPALLHGLTTLAARDRATTAALLAHLAEVDERKLYLPAGYASMFAYCVEELHFSEDAAAKRIQAARAARRFPALFGAVAEGRLHLTGVRLLAPHLTAENLEELVGAATHRGRAAIELMLARRSAAENPGLGLGASAPGPESDSSGRPELPLAAGPDTDAPADVDEHAPGHVPATTRSAESTAAPPARVLLKLSVSELTHLKLRHAQALLSHTIPSGDIAQVLDRALDALIAQLEKRKFAATSRPRQPRLGSVRPRHVPAHVRRAVWERDGGRCTFVGNAGHRCGERRFLEFDHAEPVARGGRATVELIRLRCRAHNQYEAERLFGAGFMREKRRRSKLAPTDDGARSTKEHPAPRKRESMPVPDTGS